MFEHLIILGSATNREYASAPGDIRAFDVRTGAHVWSFRTIPRKGEFGAETWPEDARAHVGGANDWAECRWTPARGIVYVPTGSGKFNFFGGYRRGDNLFSDSLIALDARTGKRLWHFQTVHHDIWDVDNNSAPQLTTITPRRPQDRRRRAGQQDRLPVRVRSRQRQADLADRGAPGAAEHDRPGREPLAHAAVPDQAGAVLPPVVHGRPT